MPRSTNPTLESLLPAAETQSTVKITLRDDSEHFLTTDDEPLQLDGDDYVNGLLKVGELKETLGQPTNRVSLAVSNIDKQFGLNIAAPSRKTELANVVVKRFYRSLSDPDIYEWKHFFTGKAVNVVVDEKQVPFDIISDTTAAGTCIATESLSPNNGWKFPETPDQAPPGSGENPGGGIGTGSCFTGETLVSITENVSLEFASLYEQRDRFIGSEIVSFDDAGNIVEDVIINIFKHSVKKYLRVELEDGEVLNVTAEHRFWTEKGFVAIGKMQIGDELLEYYAHGWHALKIVSVTEIEEEREVFNLTTYKTHHYFVDGIGTHNAKDINEPI